MKHCPKCESTKPLSDFSIQRRAKDGKQRVCKDCASRAQRKYYADDPEPRREYNRKRWYDDPDYRTASMMRSKAWNRDPDNSEKRRAHRAVENALRSGAMEKPAACEKCKRIRRLHGHHDDYSNQLDVAWVCSPCHDAIHRAAA